MGIRPHSGRLQKLPAASNASRGTPRTPVASITALTNLAKTHRRSQCFRPPGARSDDVIPQATGTQLPCRPPVAPPPVAPDYHVPVTDAGDVRGRTILNTTLKYEVQTVWYPWHPLYSQSVSCLKRFTKGGVEVCHCCELGQTESRAHELPAWMLDRAACSAMRLESRAQVNWQALVVLQQLITASQRSAVAPPAASAQVEARPQPGEAAAQTQTHANTQPTCVVRSRSRLPAGGGPAPGGSATAHPIMEGKSVRARRSGAPAPTPTGNHS